MRFRDMGLGGRGEVKSDINVTPLVSVLLVLIVNMVLLAPMDGNHGSGLLLPRAANTVDKPDPQTHELTVVAIDASNGMYLNSVRVRETELAANVKESLEGKTAKTVLIMGDKDARYSAIMAAMDSLRAAGIGDFALVVEQRANHPGGAVSSGASSAQGRK